jgi:tRNA1(Val) A37 N6-methylase TrmN6
MRRPRPPDDSPAEARGVTEDGLFGGRVRLWQPARGYRVNVDTILLAEFAVGVRPGARRLVDLGAGVGALSLAYGHLGRGKRYDLVEREPALAALATRNLAEAGAEGAAHVADLAAAGLPRLLKGTADVVLCNPPFFAEDRRSSATDSLRRGSRAGRVEPFLRAAESAMARRAYAFFAYPAPALAELLAAARAANLVAKRLRLVHAFADAPARLALIELRRAKPGGLVIDPPLVEWTAPGVRSAAVAALLGGAPRPARPPTRRASGRT